MNKIKDLINKLKRSKNRSEDSNVESSNEGEIHNSEEELNEIPPAVLSEVTSEIEVNDNLDKTSEVELTPLKNKKPKPEFLTSTFWKTHFETRVSRLKHSRLKSMKVPKDELELENGDEKKVFSLEMLREKLKDLIAKFEVTSESKGRQKNIGDHLKSLLDNSKRTPIHRVFVILLLILSFYTVGKLSALFLASSIDSPKVTRRTIELDYRRELNPAQINEMRQAKIFKTDSVENNEVKAPVIANNQKCETANKASRLPIKLINTIVLQDSVKSIASVQIRSEKLPQELREGDKIEGMAQIDKIQRLNVILKNLQDGSCEYVANNLFDDKRQNPIAVMTPKQSKNFTSQKNKIEGIENDGNDYKVSKDFLKDKMKDISSILTQARGIQITNPDGSISFKVVEVDPGGIFAYLGIQDNDIITQINGQPISDLNQVMNLFGKITNVDQLSLTIKRGGEEVPQDYKFQ